MTKNNSKSKYLRNSIIRFLFWFLFGAAIGIVIPWYFYLKYLIGGTFINYSWKIPSSVYARAYEFHNDKMINTRELDYELEILGYSRKQKAQYIGDYSSSNGKYEIHSKGFVFPDSKEKPKRIIFSVVNNRITGLNHHSARLEPLMIGQFYNPDFENRQPIPLEHIPNTMVMGLQAVEDRNFIKHHGVDFKGILRALYRNFISGKNSQGGSTITQQLIKSRWNYSQKNWMRKANEAFAAIILESELTKGEILENYFNEIYWGQNGKIAIHGINQAASYYFSKEPKQLTISEQALLTGIIKGPSWYNPIQHKNRAIQRRNTVLNSWYETSVITQSQWQRAKNDKLILKINNSFNKRSYQDAVSLIKQQIKGVIPSDTLKQQGIKIYTTINPFIQNQLLNTMQWHTNLLGKNLQSAAVVCDAQNGDILAIKGSKEKYSYYNRAINSKRQIGSLIKPFVYLAALELLDDFTLSEKIDDSTISVKTSSGEIWNPDNWDHLSLGKITAQDALIKSRNQATVRLGMKIGVNHFIRFLKKIGLNIHHSKHPSVFLGASELTVLEVTNLYLLFSSSTEQNHTVSIKHIVDYQNKPLVKFNDNAIPDSINSNIIAPVRKTLNQITQTGTAARLKNKYGFHSIYGKTGTTNEGRNSWYAGFDNQYLAVFWVGKDNNGSTSLTGASGAMELWANWYQKMLLP